MRSQSFVRGTLGWTGLVALASCVNLLELDGYAGASQSLCDSIESCYGGDLYPDCRDRIDDKLESASPQMREAYLSLFASAECTASCTKARGCLDALPLCDGPGTSCSGNEQCCGFSTGKAQCNGGACCVPLGGACSEDTPCCAGECVDGTCGGVQCRNEGETCEIDDDCCSDLLRCNAAQGFTCRSCQPLGGNCATDEDCCTDSGTCIDNLCQNETNCGMLGETCADPNECCSPLDCGVADASTEKSCCRRPGDPCDEQKLCCSGTCKDVGGTLTCCTPTGECDADAACCSGHCEVIHAQSLDPKLCCVPDGSCPNPCLPHPGPIHPSCNPGPTPIDNAGFDCIRAVCEVMPSCCCVAWTEACVAQYLEGESCLCVNQ